MHEIQWFDLLIQTQCQTGFRFWTEDVVIWQSLSVGLVLRFVIRISECNSGMMIVVLDFFLLRIFVRSYVLVLIEGNIERFGGLDEGCSGWLKSFNSLSK